MEINRETFEDEVIAQHGNGDALERSEDGYTDSEVDFAWTIWTAAIDLIENRTQEPSA